MGYRLLWLRVVRVFGFGALATELSGCVAVGYSSGGGWFIWPGGLGLVLIVLLIAFLLRRR